MQQSLVTPAVPFVPALYERMFPPSVLRTESDSGCSSHYFVWFGCSCSGSHRPPLRGLGFALRPFARQTEMLPLFTILAFSSALLLEVDLHLLHLSKPQRVVSMCVITFDS